MRYHCFFEQSGTFRDVFRDLGFESFDYDISNQYGTPDFIIDLFDEIWKSFAGFSSIFDDLRSDDFIFAFFPCTYFSVQNNLLFRKLSPGERYIRLLKRNYYFNTLLALIDVCYNRSLPLFIENPYHCSWLYFALKNKGVFPFFIDHNRTLRGDYFVKPTMYYAFNFSLNPDIKFFARKICISSLKRITSLSGFNRSIISPEYAYNFINEFIL